MIKRFFRFLFKISTWFVILSFMLVMAFKWVPVPVTPLMLIRYFEPDSHKTLKHDWVALDNISKNLQLAVICSEDQNFLNHKGFDYKAIKKAIENNKKGKGVKGASTISQQTAKNVFLWPQRSWLRKGLETYFAFLIELCWSKERIMEVYLNSIEMGNGIYGAQAASQYWFKKPASKLALQEAAAIAAILPNPRTYKANPATAYIESRKQWIVKQIGYFGPLDYTKQDGGKPKN
ncbi:monofunctional biosynthetic peptidoglycan transglycosylase [Tamlana sp. 2201CG12-4]|uniref:monofunctional biosynthetic peptidoglycan transglycosylase n=1 Tax=Tamlana sp. 2201CG12-4 TaxID=3112582 RepID=UPI002DBBED9E|nr:monofunctional biosynthetic peptidoglycan transglycosylase [Tamlana sp. 2201CG12-4]MEC3906196.1 monofunctional biosynthetic peptidoglycan transglycosylase [Tamlana sp. 2201CG12-4]